MPDASPSLLLLIFTTSLLVGLSSSVVPGPLLMVTVSQTARRGFAVAPLLVLGHGIFEAAAVVGIAVGLGDILRLAPARAVIGFLGGLFLIWMGFGVIRSAWRGTLTLTADTSRTTRGGPVLTGILVSIANPYLIAWWATVGAAYVAWAMATGVPGLTLFWGGHVLSDLIPCCLVGFGVVSGRRLLGQGFYRALLLACGAFLVALGVYFLSGNLLGS